MAGILSRVTKEPKSMPPRIVLYAGEKWGKTSFGAYCTWNPVFLMTAQETGLETLLESNQVPAVDRFPEDAKDFNELNANLRALRDEEHNWNCIVLDTGNGAEKLTSAGVCDNVYDGSWTVYQEFGKGDGLASKWWDGVLSTLDQLREQRGMAIIMLYHNKVKTFNNPTGKDFDQFKPECIDKLWQATHKWADVILYGGFRMDVKKEKAGKGAKEKVEVNGRRYLRTQPSGPIVAGNRYGLPAEIDIPDNDRGAAWKVFEEALTKARGAPGVSGRKLGMLPNLAEFTEIIKAKGRTYEQFVERTKKVYPKANLSAYGRIPLHIIEEYLQRMKELPDVGAPTSPPPSPPPPPPPPVEKPADAKPVEEPEKKSEPADTPKEPPSSPPPPPAPVEEPKSATPETDEAKAVREAAEADERKEIVERDELETAVYELAEQIGYKPRGLMELHVPRLGHRLAKGDTLASLPLPILRKFVEALQQIATQKREQSK